MGCFLFYAHPVTLATETRGGKEPPTLASVNGEVQGVEGAREVSRPGSRQASGWLLLPVRVLNRMGTEGSMVALRLPWRDAVLWGEEPTASALSGCREQPSASQSPVTSLVTCHLCDAAMFADR